MSGHELATWRPIADAPPCFIRCELRRQWIPLASLLVWSLEIQTPCPGGTWVLRKITTPGAANTDVDLGGLATPLGPDGSIGRPLKIYQVEFDETQPPDGWPPW